MPELDNFPFRRALSLDYLFEYWEAIAEEKEPGLDLLANAIMETLEEAPHLRGKIEDPSVLDAHLPLMKQVFSVVLPASQKQQIAAAVTLPYSMEPVYATPAFESLFSGEQPQMETRVFETSCMSDIKLLVSYNYILAEFYGVSFDFKYPMIFSKRHDNGLITYFRLQWDTQFMRMVNTRPLPELTEADFARIRKDPMNLSMWQKLFPADLFEFNGFVVVEAQDITRHEILSVIKNDLLQKNAMTTREHIDRLESRLRTLMNNAHLQLGLLCLLQDDETDMLKAQAVGRSILLDGKTVPACDTRHKSIYAQAVESGKTIVRHDLTLIDEPTVLEHRLLEMGYESILLAPLVNEGNVIGVLELASPKANDLNALNAMKLDEVIGLFATALQRSLDEQEDRIQAVIKKQYTAVHPAVEWRFRQAAVKYMGDLTQDPHAKLDPIVFHEVYPLYGLSDIRNSSTNRNAAIQADLVEQLELASDVVLSASAARPLPVLNEIAYRINKFTREIKTGLRTDDEINVLNFLKQQVESLFDQLRSFGSSVRDSIRVYEEALDTELDVLYKKRKNYEASVMRINDTVSSFLDEEEERAQLMFPHYFEKYKTDGVDHSLYVGASLQEDGRFDELYLRNLRLWQLMTICGIEWELNQLHPTLEVPLRATHLVLVQSTPLSIRFRLEEKQFDVDGAYNIRYEIVKKRIDKARVKGTGERLTQPGKLAIVYSQLKEAQEYRRYIEFLQATNFAEQGIEEFELEDMQGVYGLKALRFTIASERPVSSALPISTAESPALIPDLRDVTLGVESTGDGSLVEVV